MKVDNTNTYPSGGQRPSVRISSKKGYTSGLIVLDVQSMPYGCGVWPAFWTVGSAWPSGGEIDIVEGVNNNQNNQYTLHTSSGCTLDTSFAKSSTKRRRGHARRGTANSLSALAFTGKALATTCDAAVNGNAGCGISDPSNASYGKGLNDNGGGVFATLLDDDGVAICKSPLSLLLVSVANDLPTRRVLPPRLYPLRPREQETSTFWMGLTKSILVVIYMPDRKVLRRSEYRHQYDFVWRLGWQRVLFR